MQLSKHLMQEDQYVLKGKGLVCLSVYCVLFVGCIVYCLLGVLCIVCWLYCVLFVGYIVYCLWVVLMFSGLLRGVLMFLEVLVY